MADDMEVLKFTVDIGGKRAQQQMAAIEKSFKTHMGKMTKDTLKGNVITNKLLHTAEKFGTKYMKSLKLSYKQVHALNGHVKGLNAEIAKTSLLLVGANAEQKAAVKDAIKGYEEQIDLLEEIGKLQKTANLGKAFEQATEEMADDMRDSVESAFKSIVKYKWTDAGSEIGEGITDSLSSIGSRDLAGFGRGLAKSFGAGLKGVGASLTRAGAKAQNDPNASGMSKALGGLASKMGPLLETFAKLGPLISLAGSAAMAFVKLMLDADAAAKEFQKELLATASTSSYLSKNMGDVDTAVADLASDIKEIRDAAMSLENLNWGINKKDHLAVLNTLNAEGVSLRRMKEEAVSAGKSMGDFSADMVHVAVAYSRNFGVSLNEISSLQSEMMTELGGSLKSTAKDFSAMQLGAEEAGIASNKFFNIIKGVSSDLSLYNMRMEDAVHMLTLLGKVMSPRNAQKFLQTSMQGFKQMGRAEKLRMTLLAGQGATKQIVERDLNRKTKSLAEKINDAMGGQGNVDDIAKAIQSGGAAAKNIISKLPKEMQGEMADAAKQIQIDSKRSQRGLFGLSTATGNLGAGGVFEMYKKSIGKFGGKSLEESAGSIGGEMMAENLGVSQEQLDQAIKFEQAIQDQKDALVAQGMDKKKVDAMETDEVLDTMSKGDKQLLLDAGKQIDYAKRQTELTSSFLDKIDTIMDWLLNQFYNTVLDIYEAILSLPGVGSPEKKRKLDLARYAQSDEASASAKAAYKKSGGDVWKFRDELIKGIGDQVWGAKSNIDKLMEARKGATTDEAKANIDKQIGDLQNMLRQEFTALDSNLDPKARFDVVQKMSNKDLKSKISAELVKDPTKSIEDAIKAAGVGDQITPQDLSELITQAPWAIDPSMENPGKLGANAKNLDKIVANYAGGGATGTAPENFAGGPPGGGPAATPTPITPPTPTTTSEAPPTAKQADVTAATLDSLDKKASDAKKFDKGSGTNSLKGKIEDGTLESLRTALFEYYLYSGFDRKDIAAAMSGGKSTKDIIEKSMKLANEQGGSFNPGTAGVMLNENAAGGTVLKPAPGEVLASVAPGETIVPKGGFGGGGSVIQNFNGPTSEEFQAFMKNGTLKLLADWERRKRST